MLDNGRSTKLTKLANKPIMPHDLKKGIPFPNDSVDGVYHSHLLEKDFAPLRRKLETLFVGDARRRGETHQWMYDRINLPGLLQEIGFKHVTPADSLRTICSIIGSMRSSCSCQSTAG